MTSVCPLQTSCQSFRQGAILHPGTFVSFKGRITMTHLGRLWSSISIDPCLQAPCLSTMTMCCTKTRRDLECEAGRLAALAGDDCSEEGAGESHRHGCIFLAVSWPESSGNFEVFP